MEWKSTVVRKLAIFIAVVIFTSAPVTVEALGFGRIKIRSALNEPLDAEIELLSAVEKDLSSLSVSLASNEAFLRAGIDRPASLSQINFKIQQHDGRYFIRLSTKQAVREPFLNFLLDLNWKQGQMLREYTVLLDPPGQQMSTQPTLVEAPQTESTESVATQGQVTPEASPFVEPESKPAPEPAAATPAPAPIAEPTPEPSKPAVPAAEASATVPEPVAEQPKPTDEQPKIEEAKPSEGEAPSSEAAVTEEAPAPETPAEASSRETFTGDAELFPQIPIKEFKESGKTKGAVSEKGSEPTAPVGELDYGITRKNDNLWKIAGKLQPNSAVSIYQVMMALLKSNPGAFKESNVHRLKVGHVMRIEDPTLLTAMSKRQAFQEYLEQTRAWEDYKQQVASNTPKQTIVAGGEAAAEGKPTSTAAARGELSLTAPEGEHLSAGTKASEEAPLSPEALVLREEIRQALTEAQADRGQNAALNDRLKGLESRLSQMQRSLTVKDDELALLQKQLSDATAQADKDAEAARQKAATEAAATAKAEVEAKAKADAAAAQQAKVEESKPLIAPVAEVPATPAVSEPGLLDKAMGMLKGAMKVVAGMTAGLALDPMTMGIAGGALILVFLLLFVMIRRRRQTLAFQESILTGVSGANSQASGLSSLQSGLSGDSSFLSDFAISGASTISPEDSEVDPLTEADVFMAYGRFEAAEERLVGAIRDDSKRQELRVKLLELYSTMKNKSAFEAAAEEFYSMLGGKAEGNAGWSKVMGMGAEIAPENPLFKGAKASNKSTKRGAPAAESQVMDIGLETGVFQSSDFNASATPAKRSAPESVDFNFDLDSDFSSGPAGKVEKSEPESLDFSLDGDSDFALSTPGSDLGRAPASTEDSALDFDLDLGGEKSSDSSLDFDLDMGSSKKTDDALDFNINLDDATAEVDTTGPDSDMGLDFESSAPTRSAKSEGDFSLDLGDLSFDAGNDLGGGSIELDLDAADAASLDASAGTDEVGTKLDLAKAYIDMGDAEGARSILDEVMEEGSAPQKKEAQQLISQIG